MYSRYKIRTPSPPPDYTGTAFQTDALSQSVGESVTQSPPEPILSAMQAQDPDPDVRWDGPTIDEISEEAPESESKPESEPKEKSENAEIPGSLLAGMNPDDLLFIGAMLYLLSGKTGDDSFLLMAYLLTCGL